MKQQKFKIKDLPKTCPVVNAKHSTTGVEGPEKKYAKNKRIT